MSSSVPVVLLEGWAQAEQNKQASRIAFRTALQIRRFFNFYRPMNWPNLIYKVKTCTTRRCNALGGITDGLLVGGHSLEGYNPPSFKRVKLRIPNRINRYRVLNLSVPESNIRPDYRKWINIQLIDVRLVDSQCFPRWWQLAGTSGSGLPDRSYSPLTSPTFG